MPVIRAKGLNSNKNVREWQTIVQGNSRHLRRALGGVLVALFATFGLDIVENTTDLGDFGRF